MNQFSTNGTTLDTPAGVQMFALLQCRGRLHIELGSGMGFRDSTLASLRRAGITGSRSKWQALCDLNGAIAAAGGPRDERALSLQKRLALAGKPHTIASPIAY